MTVQLGVLLALCCAVSTNLAFLCKQLGARVAPDLDGTRSPVLPPCFAPLQYGNHWVTTGTASVSAGTSRSNR